MMNMMIDRTHTDHWNIREHWFADRWWVESKCTTVNYHVESNTMQRQDSRLDGQTDQFHWGSTIAKWAGFQIVWNDVKFFKVPEVSFDSIRTKLTMKIFDEYSNMLRWLYSIRIRRRGILNLINQYHLWTRGVATVYSSTYLPHFLQWGWLVALYRLNF